ncbi:MAG: NADH-quinone oxidoreductase subunit NuoE [Gammaproteobacteria bacterium]
MAVEAEAVVLSQHARQAINAALKNYPAGRKRSAVFVALREVQHDNQGYLTVPLMDAVAAYLELQPIMVYEVASFYSLYATEPVGRHSISVCTNISCMLRGAEDIVAHLEKRLDVKTGESTPDGRCYLRREEECLAACKDAPMMMVDHKYYLNLTPAKVDAILEELK